MKPTIECMVFRHVQCPSPSLKVPDLWKSTTSWAGSFWGAGFYPDLYLGPGSCGGTGPKSPSSWESSLGGKGLGSKTDTHLSAAAVYGHRDS